MFTVREQDTISLLCIFEFDKRNTVNLLIHRITRMYTKFVITFIIYICIISLFGKVKLIINKSYYYSHNTIDDFFSICSKGNQEEAPLNIRKLSFSTAK